MKQYLMAHDLGTSGNKATLFTTDGELVGSEVISYDAHYFNDGWVEQNPEDWWNAVCVSGKNLIRKTNIDSKDILAVSFSGQMMGCLCVDKEGNPLRPSIIWADQRAVKETQKLENKISQWDFYQLIGHRNTPSYGIQKLMWVKEHEPEVYKNTYKVLNAKDYIVLKLTGKFFTDPSDANSCGCYELESGKWSERIIEYAEVDFDKFPEIKPSTYIAGTIKKEASVVCGLSEDTKVVIGAGDGVVANIGCGSIAPGKTYSCMGTSAWITSTSEKPVYDKKMRVVTWPHVIPGLYAPNGTMQYAGGSYSWLKNTLCDVEGLGILTDAVEPYVYLNKKASESSVGANGLIFLPHLLGERAPRWNPNVKGAWIGMTPETNRSDIIRSVLEGVSMNLEICLQILRKEIKIEKIMIVGGGARSDVWRQIMADIYDVDITVPMLLEESNSMGAAVIAGVGCGIYKDFDIINKFIQIKEETKPNPVAVKAYKKIKEIFEMSYCALEKVFESMKGIV